MSRWPAQIGAVLAVLLAGPVLALEKDRQQPLKINAASVSMNEKTGVTLYRGNVVVVQGSMRIEANQVEVQSRALQVQTIIATGQPVRLRALLDNSDDELKASGDKLVVRADTREVDLSGNAQMQQGPNRFTAAHVHYALDKQSFSARGNGDGRVYAIFQPGQKLRP